MDQSSLEAEIESLKTNVGQLAGQVREIEERFDTLSTPLWRRIVFRIDGWGPWHTLRARPRWRPWRGWWTS